MHVLASSSFSSPSSPIRRALVVLLLCLTSTLALAQAAGSDYTVDLPSVERVKAEIKGSNPTDTQARQAAVFSYLLIYVYRIMYNRNVRGPYTPGETRVVTAYTKAAYEITQDYAKTHTPDEVKAFEHLHGEYEMNSDFYKDWSKRLIGPQSAAAYHGAESELAAGQRAHIAQEQSQYQKDVAAQSTANGLSQDPTAVTSRRCLELGGDSAACVGKGLISGIIDMVGLGDTISSMTGPTRIGVVLSGTYRGASTRIDFTPDTAGILSCGDLLETTTPYTIRKSPASLQLILENQPHAITLAMNPDGSLTGPGVVPVTGSIIVGYQNKTTTQMVNGSRAIADQCNGPCQTTTSVPVTAPKTVSCSIASFAPPSPRQSSSAALPGASFLGTIAPPSEPGLRMVGKYTSSTGLFLDFAADKVTLDCGPAHVKQPYTVENTPTQLLIHVQNSGGPFTLAVAPDNSLRGSGSTTVNGRLVTGMNGDNISYKPSSQQCNVTTLTPASTNSSSAIATNVSATPPPAVASSARAPAPSTAPAPAATSAPASASAFIPAPTGPRAAMRVIISSLTGSNIMAGQQVYIMRERIDDVLRKLGVPVPPNSTPAKAMAIFGNTCKTQNCGPIVTGLTPYYVTGTKLDASGKATLSATAATGAYFIFAIAQTPTGSYMWDIPTNFTPGDNNITLTTANADIIPK